MMSKTGEIRRDDTCLDYGQGSIILYGCHGSMGNQEWKVEAWGGLRNPSSGKCLAINSARDKLVMEACQQNESRQKWRFENLNRTLISS